MKSLVVGDVHIKTNNIELIDQLTEFIVRQIGVEKPDYVVLLGDVLDYHEKVITPCLNRAYTLVSRIAALSPVYVLVGNHDYISNAQFLTENHWMNALKRWENVTIVDKVVAERGATFCPYVSPGRFAEALHTVPGSELSPVIYCHQEFRGCDMGVVRSEIGDAFGSTGLVVSGHIHDNQWLGSNIYYVGAPLQHAFGEKEKRVVALVEDGRVREVDVGIGLKRTMSVSVADLSRFKLDVDPRVQHPSGVAGALAVQTRLTVAGTVAECKAFKKTAQYKTLSKTAKIVFRMVSSPSASPESQSQKYRPFTDVCLEKISLSRNPDVGALFASLIQSR